MRCEKLYNLSSNQATQEEAMLSPRGINLIMWDNNGLLFITGHVLSMSLLYGWRRNCRIPWGIHYKLEKQNILCRLLSFLHVQEVYGIPPMCPWRPCAYLFLSLWHRRVVTRFQIGPITAGLLGSSYQYKISEVSRQKASEDIATASDHGTEPWGFLALLCLGTNILTEAKALSRFAMGVKVYI